MVARIFIAKQLYESHCSAVGTKPSWESLVKDPNKRPVVEMWLAAADRSIPSQATRKPQPTGWE